MNNTHIKLDNIWHHYGDPYKDGWSIKALSLELSKGELLGLLGPSGCGKTSILRLIAGFEKPSKGSIFIDEIEVANANRLVPPESRGVGMVFQDYALFPHLNAWQNVCFGLKNPKPENINRVEWLFELLGLTSFVKRYPHELSGGQRQRLALARALAPGSSLVLLDEPFSNLDVEVRLRLRSELSRVLKSCNASGILVTHDPQEALAICDRVAVIKEGELHQCSIPSEIIKSPQTSFVGHFVLQRNIFPVEISQSKLITPLGNISNPDFSKTNVEIRNLIVDECSLEVIPSPIGSGLVQSREFLGSYWLLRVLLDDLILRIRHPLENPLDIGSNCHVRFKTGSQGILFPGSFACNLE